jgi:hypothetical protein
MCETTDSTYTSGKAGTLGGWPHATAPTGYEDNFVDTSGTALTAHTPDGSSAFAWTAIPVGSPVAMTIENNKADARGLTAPVSRHGSSNADTAAGTEFRATIGINLNALGSMFTGGSAGVGLMTDLVAQNGYHATLQFATTSTCILTLLRFAAGAQTSLSNLTIPRPAAGTHELTIELLDNNIVRASFGNYLIADHDNTYSSVPRPSIECRTDSTQDFAIEYFKCGTDTSPPLIGLTANFEVTGVSAELSGSAGLDPDDVTISADGNLVLVPFIESGPIEIGDGDHVYRVQRIVPDEKNLGDVRARFYTGFFPTETEVERGPYTLTNPTSVRFAARQVRLRLEEASAGENWRIGVTRLGIIQEGRR